MRYLHPVAASEKFIARGIYRFHKGDELLPDTEAWTRHRVAGGGILTRIDRQMLGMTTLAEVLEDEAGRFERVSVREWNVASLLSYKTLRADYIFFKDYAQASRRFDEAETTQKEIHFSPETTIIGMPFTVYGSVEFKHLTANPGPQYSSLRPIWWSRQDDLVEIYDDIDRPKIVLSDAAGFIPRYTKTPTVIYDIDHYGFMAVDDHNIPLQCQIQAEAPYNIVVLTEYAHI